ncbi:MAG: DUF2179 domain-containing protein [Planctomycetes bacterium]|nr:DUF2179 domain-containing protein [Planctomycetota bacterium]
MAVTAALFPDTPLFSWVILPGLIFLARITDVSVGTVRLILVARGFKYLAPIAGFFEVLIWILVIGQIMQNLTNPVCYIAYAGGFATGNFVGLWIAEKLSLGMVLIRVITPKPAGDLLEGLRGRQYGVTAIDGQGANGPVQIVFTIVPRRQADTVVELVKTFNPHAFYSIEEVDSVERGVFPRRARGDESAFLALLRPFRKGK